jgi:hypothetical protein
MKWWEVGENYIVLLYSFPSLISVIKSRRMRWAGHVAWLGEKRNAYRILVGKPEGKRLLGIPRCRWVYNIWMDIREIGWDVMDWIGLGQDRMEGSCGYGNEPPGSIKCWEVLEYLHSWRLLKKGSALWVSEWVSEWDPYWLKTGVEHVTIWVQYSVQVRT